MKKKKREQVYPQLRYIFIMLMFLFAVISFMILPVLINSLRTDVGYDEIVQDCSNIPSDRERIVATGVTEFDASDYTSTVITEENASQIEQVGTFYLNRDRFETNPYSYHDHPPITHPAVDYLIYPHFFPSFNTRIAICGEESEPFAMIETGELSGKILFSPDGSLFVIGESYYVYRGSDIPALQFFDATTLEETYSIDTDNSIRDIAFHPDLSLMAISSSYLEYHDDGSDVYYVLSIWNYETGEEISHVDIQESHLKIYFNQDGTAIINYSPIPNTPVYIWGVPSE